MPRRKPPVSSFGPELLQAILRAGRERFEVPFPSEALAHQFRTRVYDLRAAMRAEEHPDWEAASRGCIGKTLVQPDGSALLPMYPKDSQFAEILAGVGIKAPELPRDPTIPDLLDEFKDGNGRDPS